MQYVAHVHEGQYPCGEALEELLREGLASLPKRMRQVLTLYFGLDGQAPKTLNEIKVMIPRLPYNQFSKPVAPTGATISRERVRQIARNACWRLKRHIEHSGALPPQNGLPRGE